MRQAEKENIKLAILISTLVASVAGCVILPRWALAHIVGMLILFIVVLIEEMRVLKRSLM